MSISVGVHLSLLSMLFTYYHYGEIPHDPLWVAKVIAFEMSVAHVAYGYDRGQEVFVSSGIATGVLISEPMCWPFLPMIAMSSIWYKHIKQHIKGHKPLFVASMWVIASCWIPWVMLEHSYVPMCDPGIPLWFQTAAVSNIMDIPDMEEDRSHGVDTYATKFGATTCERMSLLALAVSTFAIEPYPYSWLFWSQNVCLQWLIATRSLRFKRPTKHKKMLRSSAGLATRFGTPRCMQDRKRIHRRGSLSLLSLRQRGSCLSLAGIR